MEFVKHIFIRTPFEKPLQKIRYKLNFIKRNQHPELEDIYLEASRIEQILSQILHKSSNCIDIGAHLGSMLSKIMELSPDGHHMAFEPTPIKASWLKKKFPEIDVKQIALSDVSGEVNFYINTSRSGFSGLYQEQPKNKHNNLKKITVQCDKLDNILEPNYQVDFLKIDVEGVELGVMRGGEKTISCYHPIILFECTRGGLKKSGYTSEQMYEFLNQRHLYSIFLVKDFLNDEKPLSFEQFDKALNYPFQAFNFIASYRE